MKVKLDKSYPLPASADAAWTLLQDIEGVAGCMPGAAITERVDASHYKGTVAVKFGPASLLFRGDLEVKALDGASRTLQLVGKGTDSTGGSGATLDLTARVEALDATSCNLVGNSEVSMSGKAAAFGARLAGPVAEQVLKQFVANFSGKVQALQAGSGSAVAGADGAADPAAGAAAPAAAPAEQPAQLNGLALAWAIVKEWLRSLFSAKKA
jgi:uncharacterized protein